MDKRGLVEKLLDILSNEDKNVEVEVALELDLLKLKDEKTRDLASGAVGEQIFEMCGVFYSIGLACNNENETKATLSAIENIFNTIFEENNINIEMFLRTK